GAVTTTTVAICHHQTYAVGNILPVRYDAKAPTHAAERDMPPVPNLALPALVLSLGIAAAGVSALVAARRHAGTVSAEEPLDETDEGDSGEELLLAGVDA